jgi:hypothetical protein
MQRDGVAIGVAWIGVAGFCVFVWLAWEVISRLFLASTGLWSGAWSWAAGLFGG